MKNRPDKIEIPFLECRVTQHTIDPSVYAILRGFPFYNDSLTNVCNEIIGFLEVGEQSI